MPRWDLMLKETAGLWQQANTNVDTESLGLDQDQLVAQNQGFLLIHTVAVNQSNLG